jgi:hypothetical protein
VLQQQAADLGVAVLSRIVHWSAQSKRKVGKGNFRIRMQNKERWHSPPVTNPRICIVQQQQAADFGVAVQSRFVQWGAMPDGDVQQFGE